MKQYILKTKDGGSKVFSTRTKAKKAGRNIKGSKIIIWK